ncbi:hypothetical protein F4826_001055 [Rahnella inusitata]|nr:hypothetical protein [Rahnella inusitata]
MCKVAMTGFVKTRFQLVFRYQYQAVGRIVASSLRARGRVF